MSEPSAPSPAAPSEKALFLAALDLPQEQRASFLAESCLGNDPLRHRLETLLRNEAETLDFLTPQPSEQPLPEVPRSGDSIGYFGDYVLLDEIARGSTGVVFRARQKSLNRLVALKMLRDRPALTSPDENRRFQAEAEAAASLDHPNIVPIYEVGTHEGQAYFSMKLLEGGTLDFRAAEYRQQPREAVRLIATVARAVHHAHRRGILHRDLKPGNILLNTAGEPHVTDFGLARRLETRDGLTLSGQILGTPHYMAPEQARGANRSLTPGADIYSLGAMLYELLGGRRPFQAEDLLSLLKQVAEDTPPPLRSINPAIDPTLERIVHRCLARIPDQRYPTAAALADDLDRWSQGLPVLADANAPRPRWSRRRVLAGSALALAAVPSGLWWQHHRKKRTLSDGHGPSSAPPPAPGSPALSRRAAEWILPFNGPHGGLDAIDSTGRQLHLPRHPPLPPGEWHLRLLYFDRLDIDLNAPAPYPADFSLHLNGLRHLTQVFFRRLPSPPDSLAFLTANPELIIFKIADCQIDKRLFDYLAPLPKLVELSLEALPEQPLTVTADDLVKLQCLSRLERLVLFRSVVTRGAIEMLAIRAQRLQRLACGLNGLPTDADLAPLIGHPSLSRLDVSESVLTDAGFLAFAANTALREIVITATPVTDAGVASFQARRPDVHIIR